MKKKLKLIVRIGKKIGIVLVLLIFLFLTGTTIWNKVMCMREASATEQPGTEVHVNGVGIQASVTGEGEKTIVLLSGLGTPSPIVDFKPLADKLKDSYRVVTLEYTGYGFSEDADVDRSNEAIVEEIRETLKQLNISPPYVLMPHSISGVYCMQYIKMYPDEVEAMIGIDSSVPNQAKYDEGVNVSKGLYYLTKFMDATGLTRLSYVSGNPMIMEMEASGSYSKEDIKILKDLTNKKQVTRALFNEIKAFYENFQSLYDVKFPEDKPVLFILSKDTCEKTKLELNKRGYDTTWEGLHEEVISNTNIQKIIYLEGQHYLHWTQAEEIAEQTKEFLK